MVLLETPPITTSSTRSKTAAAAAAASAPPPRRPSRSTLAPEEASVAAGAEDEASEPSVVPPRERSGGATRPTATARRAYAGEAERAARGARGRAGAEREGGDRRRHVCRCARRRMMSTSPNRRVSAAHLARFQLECKEHKTWIDQTWLLELTQARAGAYSGAHHLPRRGARVLPPMAPRGGSRAAAMPDAMPDSLTEYEMDREERLAKNRAVLAALSIPRSRRRRERLPTRSATGRVAADAPPRPPRPRPRAGPAAPRRAR